MLVVNCLFSDQDLSEKGYTCSKQKISRHQLWGTSHSISLDLLNYKTHVAAVVERNVSLRLMLSRRPYLLPSRQKHLNSMLNWKKNETLVEIKIFHVIKALKNPPEIQYFPLQNSNAKFKGAHSKYFVTEKFAFVGTSNWSEDYFTTTAGVSLAVESLNRNLKTLFRKSDSDIRQKLYNIFQRDWVSIHCSPYIPTK